MERLGISDARRAGLFKEINPDLGTSRPAGNSAGGAGAGDTARNLLSRPPLRIGVGEGGGLVHPAPNIIPIERFLNPNRDLQRKTG